MSINYRVPPPDAHKGVGLPYLLTSESGCIGIAAILFVVICGIGILLGY